MGGRAEGGAATAIEDRSSGRCNRPTVVTVTVSWNGRRWLAECIGSLLASDADGIDLDVLLIDNGSTDGGPELVAAAFPSVQVLRNVRNEGFAVATNMGLRYALERRADYVFLLNPDTRTPPNLLHQVVNFMETWPEYGIVGPMQHVYTDDGAASAELNEWSRGALEVGESHAFVHTWPDHASGAGPAEGRAPATLEHAYVQGAALLCRVDVLRRIGLLDPAYHSYYEETDLCRRVRWAGWRVALLLDAGIQHFGGGSTRDTVGRRRKMLRNKYYFLLSDPTWTWWHMARLTGRWLRLDLRRRGGAPAETTWDAVGDTLLGVVWLAGQAPRLARRRRSNHRLYRDGAGGPVPAAAAVGSEDARPDHQ